MAQQQSHATTGTLTEIFAPQTRGTWTSQQFVIEIEPANTGKDGKVWPPRRAVFEINPDKTDLPEGFDPGATVKVEWRISDRQGKDGRWWQGRYVLGMTVTQRAALETQRAAPQTAGTGAQPERESAAQATTDDPLPF